MLFRLFSKSGVREESNPEFLPAVPNESAGMEDDGTGELPAEGRRLMYERIARGNALAEAEDNARRKRRGY